MPLQQLNSVALIAAFLALIAGTALAKRGAAILSDAQQRELAAMGPDWVGNGAIAGAFVLGLFAPQLQIWSLLGAAVAGLVAALRFPLRLSRQPWPYGARRLLLAGNLIIIGGAVLFGVLRAVPHINS